MMTKKDFLKLAEHLGKKDASETEIAGVVAICRDSNALFDEARFRQMIRVVATAEQRVAS